jgi:hypothetical protein
LPMTAVAVKSGACLPTKTAMFFSLMGEDLKLVAIGGDPAH